MVKTANQVKRYLEENLTPTISVSKEGSLDTGEACLDM